MSMEIQHSEYLIKEGEKKREIVEAENRKKNEIIKKKIEDFIKIKKTNPEHKRKINFIKFYDDKNSDSDFSNIIENNLFFIRINKSNDSMGFLKKKIYYPDDTSYLASKFYKYDIGENEFIFHIYDINNETIKKSEGSVLKKDFSDNNNLKNYDIFVVPENDDRTFNEFFMDDKPNIDKNNNSSLLNRLNPFNRPATGGKKRRTKKTIKTTKKAGKSRRKTNKK